MAPPTKNSRLKIHCQGPGTVQHFTLDPRAGPTKPPPTAVQCNQQQGHGHTVTAPPEACRRAVAAAKQLESHQNNLQSRVKELEDALRAAAERQQATFYAAEAARHEWMLERARMGADMHRLEKAAAEERCARVLEEERGKRLAKALNASQHKLSRLQKQCRQADLVAAEQIADWECTRVTLPTQPPQPKKTVKRIMSRRKAWSQLDDRGRRKHLGKVKQRVKDLAAKLGTELDGQFTVRDVSVTIKPTENPQQNNAARSNSVHPTQPTGVPPAPPDNTPQPSNQPPPQPSNQPPPQPSNQPPPQPSNTPPSQPSNPPQQPQNSNDTPPVYTDLNEVLYHINAAKDHVEKIEPRRVIREARNMNSKVPKRIRGPLNASQLLLARKIVAAKDAGGMSDKAYMLMRRAQPNMMPFQRVQREMHSQNDYITLKDMEETVDGCRRPVREVVEKVLASKNIKDAVLRKKEANLRFAADGRRTTRKKKTVMSVFSVMEESETVGHNGSTSRTASECTRETNHMQTYREQRRRSSQKWKS